MSECGGCGRLLDDAAVTVTICADCCAKYDNLSRLVRGASEEIMGTCSDDMGAVALYYLGRIIGMLEATKKGPFGPY
jgi:hypothetical protein